MTLILKSDCGLRVHYSTSQIRSIEHTVAGNLYNHSDLEGNGIKADESVMVINFNDGTQSTFSSDWKIVF